jgi:hypothetical protein
MSTSVRSKKSFVVAGPGGFTWRKKLRVFTWAAGPGACLWSQVLALPAVTVRNLSELQFPYHVL